MTRRIVGLVALAGLAVSGLLAVRLAGDGGDEIPGTGPDRVRSLGPPQSSARLLALRVRPGNPPRFAVMTLDDDGSRRRVLIDAPAGEIERLRTAAWSPDAARVYVIAATEEREGDGFTYYASDLFVVDADGGEPRRLTTSEDVVAVVPAPDGKSLLLARADRPGRRPWTYSLRLVDADGRNERRLLDPEDGQMDIPGSWSPDGLTIAFTRCREARPDARGLIEPDCGVYLVSPEGQGLRALGRGSQPAFSPDGQRIAFVSDRDRNGRHAVGSDENALSNELYVMGADGDDVGRLTETEDLDEAAPAWSPDGSRIAYARTGPARFKEQLMVVRADGRCPTRVAGNAAATNIRVPSFEAPAWRPGRLTGELAPLACD